MTYRRLFLGQSIWESKSNSGEGTKIYEKFLTVQIWAQRNYWGHEFKNAQVWNCREHLTGLFQALIPCVILSGLGQYSIFILFYPEVHYDHVFLNKKKYIPSETNDDLWEQPGNTFALIILFKIKYPPSQTRPSKH